ncbi:MAG: cytochrome c oxidase subunit, partial [Phycisphaerales bacterium]|nr:cytochrome c oxidase subunit [Phycisphaerales bacterium]
MLRYPFRGLLVKETSHVNTRRLRVSFRPVQWAAVAAAALLSAAAAPASAAPAVPLAQAVEGWRWWWLPRNYSAHGGAVDLLFTVIFVITSLVGIAVFYYLLKFCIKYRYRPTVAKAHFFHGNKRLELIWTLVPAVLLLSLALWTKVAWDRFRSPPEATDQNRAQILVVGEQFKWNVVYPGADGRLGRYLVYPKTTDPKWPLLPPGDTDSPFPAEVPGPAYLPPDKARGFLNEYIANKNPLGKDFADPAGLDDDYQAALNRPVYVPKGRPVEIHLSSKDVIHDFFLPDYRVKLDAVPGMKGLIYFTATTSSAEIEALTRRTYPLDEVATQLGKKTSPDFRILIGAEEAGKYSVKTVTKKKVRKGGRMVDEEVAEETPVAANEQAMTPEMVAQLKSLGVTTVTAYVAKHWDLVCEELCGA